MVVAGVPQSVEGARGRGADGGPSGPGDPHSSHARPHGGRQRQYNQFSPRISRVINDSNKLDLNTGVQSTTLCNSVHISSVKQYQLYIHK